MTLYGAMDLHSTSNVVAIIDEAGNKIVKKKLRNETSTILSFLEPYKPALPALWSNQPIIGTGWLICL